MIAYTVDNWTEYDASTVNHSTLIIIFLSDALSLYFSLNYLATVPQTHTFAYIEPDTNPHIKA